MTASFDRQGVVAGARQMMEALGQAADPEAKGTPERVADAFKELFAGLYAPVPRVDILSGPDDLVILKNLRFYSVCAHHWLPFFGSATVAYRPCEGRICGLGDIAVLIEHFARQPQLQERLTDQIAGELWRALRPEGLLVRLVSDQLCVQMRGPRQTELKTETVARRGRVDGPLEAALR